VGATGHSRDVFQAPGKKSERSPCSATTSSPFDTVTSVVECATGTAISAGGTAAAAVVTALGGFDAFGLALGRVGCSLRSMTRRVDAASRLIAASPDAVYRAFSDAGSLMQWLPPGDMTGRALEYEFREGGRYAIELTYGDSTPGAAGKSRARADVSRGRFIELRPGERIRQSVVFESSDAAFAGEMIMTWAFEAQDEGTRVTVSAENVPSGITREDHDAGMRASLENLARFLAAKR
jgi:uncharacterized protein YndB with AHSA1/START domain